MCDICDSGGKLFIFFKNFIFFENFFHNDSSFLKNLNRFIFYLLGKCVGKMTNQLYTPICLLFSKRLNKNGTTKNRKFLNQPFIFLESHLRRTPSFLSQSDLTDPTGNMVNIFFFLNIVFYTLTPNRRCGSCWSQISKIEIFQIQKKKMKKNLKNSNFLDILVTKFVKNITINYDLKF